MEGAGIVNDASDPCVENLERAYGESMLLKGWVAISLWALGREGEVQRRGLRAVLKDLAQTPSIRQVDMERMRIRLKVLYGSNSTRGMWTKAYRRVDRALEL